MQDYPSDIFDKIAESISGIIEDNSAGSIVKSVTDIINTALASIL